ncbi:5-demethoxyubiquinone hydroxylase [Chlorella vulgaris]
MIACWCLARLLPVVAHCGERNVLLPLLQTRGAASKAPGSLPDLPFSVNNSSRSNVHGDGGGSGGPLVQPASHPSQSRPVTHKKLQQILRTDLAAEEATAALYRGQQAVLGHRPDLAAFQQREEQHAQGLRQLAPGHRARPSLLAPALRAGFWALGAAAAVAPRQLSAAVTAGIHDALTDVCNEQLREMREEGLSEGAPQVRQAVIAIRDEVRDVEGSPLVPDVLALQRLKELTPPEALAAAVKLGAKTAIDLAGKF